MAKSKVVIPEAVEKLKLAITRLHRIDDGTPTKAFFDLAVMDSFVLNGYRIIEGKDGLFVSSPRECGKDGKWYTTVIPMTRDVKDAIEYLAMELYGE